ncbi:nucleotidyltransferase [Virgibacillus dakarensis]|nr:nucleotidyltransferase [Virgibacillus dakarensis]
MDQSKEIRWKQRFENFSRSYKLLDKYAEKPIETELERAGIIHFFEMTFELSWKVLKDYLEMQGYKVSSPREAIKQAFQIDLIENGHVWMEALTKRNLTTHTYDEEMAKEFVEEITVVFLPEFKLLYERLLKEE